MKVAIDATARTAGLKPEQAATFANSMRGQYIISQALVIAARVIDNPTLDIKFREPSNASDMRYLAEHMFNLYLPIEAADRKLREKL